MGTNNQTMPVNKGPLIGIIIAILGIVLIVTSLLGRKPPEPGIEATIRYAGPVKTINGGSYQTLTIAYSFEGNTYTPNINFPAAGYKQGQKIEVDVNPVDPEKATLHITKTPSNLPIVGGVIFIILGVLLFLNIIKYQEIEQSIKNGSFSVDVIFGGNPIDKLTALLPKKK